MDMNQFQLSVFFMSCVMWLTLYSGMLLGGAVDIYGNPPFTKLDYSTITASSFVMVACFIAMRVLADDIDKLKRRAKEI